MHLSAMIKRMAGASFAIAVLCSTVVAACGGDGAESGRAINDVTRPPEGLWTVAAADPDAPWLPILATRELAVGVERLAFALETRADLPPVSADDPPTVRASLYHLDGDPGTARAVRFARFLPAAAAPLAAHAHVDGSVSDNAVPIRGGLYVVPVRLDAPGRWGILFEISSADGAVRDELRFRFSVRERPAAPAVGQRAPAVATPTVANAAGLTAISSDPDPEPAFYAHSLDDALELGIPVIIAFATPAYCHSRTCAPVLDIVKAVWRDRPSEIAVVHIEIFANPDEPDRLREADAFIEWRLPSEPWVFLVDGGGVIAAAWEGAFAESELRTSVRALIGD